MMITKEIRGRWAGMLLLGSIVFQAEATDLLVSMEIKRPTCDLTFSGLDNGAGNYTYPMGNLTTGTTKRHAPFKAIIDCSRVAEDASVNTALTASVRKGTVVASRIRMQVDGQDNVSAPELWLETGTRHVPLNGSTTFCKGNGNRNECTLTPYTQVPENSPKSDVSATVVFNVEYA
ncbi:hypothetical protein MZB74_21525 [Escherichia coli]|uniref:hypothetical protein n=1 Tax=Enterobacteriaceae TaxID=543 RepID=UPI000663722C|nr:MULTISPECIES: hypothetical protein [Enterobacteriaceae]EFK4582022.1 hypothetical protein [Escherichia coli]MBZ9527048.1 hypothetical protein [Escherichia coli]MCQ0072530.1 hypothetical protein [Escherichia coli]MCQ0080995.1 hypothetical protein [Escherichia coli]MCQ0088947.1 hypothetical protein [Escherichia coli]